MEERIVTVFGGTGFLGRRVVRSLAATGCRVRVAARRPQATDFSDIAARVRPIKVDIRDQQAVVQAVEGAAAVVNAVSLFVEKGPVTFEKIHVEAAAKVARAAREAGARRLVHVSGIGASHHSPSSFVRARANGEDAVSEAFPRVVMVRPSVMCGCDDSLISSLEQVTRLPVVPLFGRGESRLQPAFVEDVGAAIARLAVQPEGPRTEFELGGSEVFTYREAVELMLDQLCRQRLLMPVPFSFWQFGVSLLKALPDPPLTRDQLILMQSDNLVAADVRTFADLGMSPSGLREVVDKCYPRSETKAGSV